MYAFFGFLGGLVFFLIALLAGDQTEFTGIERVLFGMGAPIILPIVYGIVGFIAGHVSAWIFNVAVKWAGGLQIDLDTNQN